jgi:hypothetical protein
MLKQRVGNRPSSLLQSLFAFALVIAATFGVYWVKPFWPTTVRPFPWLAVASPFFLTFLTLLLLCVQKMKITKFLISSILLLTMYFFIEGFGWTLIFSYFDGLRPPSWVDLLFIGLVNVVANLPAATVFTLLQVMRKLLMKRPRLTYFDGPQRIKK